MCAPGLRRAQPMSSRKPFYVGNAKADQVGDGGWFVGQFVPAELGLRRQTEVELKWGIHPDGEKRPEPWASQNGTTISVLIEGGLKVTFHIDGSHQEVILRIERRLRHLWTSGRPLLGGHRRHHRFVGAVSIRRGRIAALRQPKLIDDIAAIARPRGRICGTATSVLDADRRLRGPHAERNGRARLRRRSRAQPGDPADRWATRFESR